MSHKDDKQTGRSQLVRVVFFSCCFLLLVGVTYWYYAANELLPTAVSAPPKSADVPDVGGEALPQVAIATDSAQSLPKITPTTEQLPATVSRKVVKRRIPKVRTEATLEIPDVKPVESAPVVIVAAPPVAVVDKKAVATAFAEPVEIKPFAQPVSVAVLPTEVKPVIVQPVPTTVNPVPVIKRKTKNDEDVEIDLN